ncbi:MAG: hypothetical protein J0L95_02860 [Candidatus Accumulibacter sp.]|jgi:hypothetical protein|uniref:hypothetical protein n=1 Tax=Accumulibacter sp. TaxID=2053492 RepID=UPI001AC57834|nr:hypothetical protein [Accumulibacter sp.]MBN8436974.1 hypothetical protein [Accumulibacter sp.]
MQITSFLHSRLSLTFGLLLIAWLIVIGTFQLAGMRETFVLQRASIQHDTGCAYVIAHNHQPASWPVTTFVSDSESTPQASRLILLQDSLPFGQPHAMHDDIRNKGNGKYSYWEGTLYFSLPNCADPRESESIYTVSIPASLTKLAKLSWFIAAVLFGYWIKKPISEHPIMHGALSFCRKVLDLPLTSLNLLQRPYRAGMFLALLLIAVGCCFAWLWDSGISTSLAVGGAYQVSDAMAYWTCANALLDMGHFGNATSFTSEWCQRRAIYPNMLSGLAWMAQRNIHTTLLLQAAIVCLGIFVLMRRSSPYIGAIGMALGTTLLLSYATADLFVLTMTENAGLIFGCIGFALLLKSTENRSLAWVVAGVAMFSIALNARAGAFLVLPFLILWSGIFAYSLKRKAHIWIFATVIATFAGFALQALLVIAVGGNPGSSHGNFSYVLYGLTAGGMGWQQVLVDHPELLSSQVIVSDALTSKSIYALAWANINLHPELFLQGLTKNLTLFMSTGTYGYEKLGAWAGLVKLCWWFAWIPVLTNARKPAYLLIALASIGIIVSTPFLLGDGGPRIFAATVAVDVVQIGLGLHWIFSALKHVSTGGLFAILSQKYPEPPNAGKSLFSIEMGLALFVLSLMMIPQGLTRKPVLPNIPSDGVCKSDEYMVITYFGNKSSMLLSFVDKNDSPPQIIRGDITKDKFSQGIPIAAWFRDQAIEFKGRTLLAAYQLDQSDTFAPGPYLTTSDNYLSKEYYGKLVSLCIDKNKQTIMFGTPYGQLNSIAALD